MQRALLAWLACPGCRSPELALDVTRARTRTTFVAREPDREVEEILEGELRCPACRTAYPVRQGIPRLLPDGGRVSEGSAHRWTTFDPAVPRWEEAFLDCAQPLGPKDFLGRLVLDAGCGFGRHSYFAARYGADVVALDVSRDAVHAAQRNTHSLASVHVVQGDLTRPPFKEGLFDVIYSFGVLHHLDDPFAALDELHMRIRSGGRLALWVYGPRQGVLSWVGDWMGRRTAALSPDDLHRVSTAVAYGLRAGSHVPYRLLHHVPGARVVVGHLPGHDHHRWPLDVVVSDVYDRLRNPVRATFTGEELEAWFARHGYASIRVQRRVRNTESFVAGAVRR